MPTVNIVYLASSVVGTYGGSAVADKTVVVAEC